MNLRVVILCLLAAAQVGAQDAATESRVDSARSALDRWVETRRLISQERQQWELGRELLNDRIQLIEREIVSFRERIADAERSVADADSKRAELVAESARLDAAKEQLETTVATLEQRTRTLLTRLPEPIRAHVDLLAQRLPADSSKTDLRLSTRFQNLVGILNEIDKFNTDITVTREVRTLADGRNAEVTTFYVGLGQGYYVTDKGDAAGQGVATPEGWKWLPATESAEQIAHAIAILRNEQPAAFVQLPVRVQ